MSKHMYNEESILCKSQEEKAYNISVIIFWGAIWGLIEATVGNILHMLPFRVPTGSILFPIGYYFMKKSYKETNDLKSIFYTSSIAASIKLINLFTPTTPIVKVLNPSACILLEGLVVVLVFKLLEYKESNLKYIHILIMSLSWRVGYYIMCFVAFIPLGLMKSSSIVDKNKFIEFFFVNGFINSLIIYFYTKIAAKVSMGNYKEIRIKYNPIFSICLFVFALFIQWLA
ncbi:MAG: hypothetical protein AB2417_15275 [Clostridiaceae bacterium]